MAVPGEGWGSVIQFAGSALLSRPTAEVAENRPALGYSTDSASHLPRREVPRGARFEPGAHQHLSYHGIQNSGPSASVPDGPPPVLFKNFHFVEI